MSNFQLLQKLCEIHAPSGNESAATQFIYSYIEKNSFAWKSKPCIYSGKGFQDCLILVFGQPRTAVYTHIDSVGYMVGYNKKLLPIGTPRPEPGIQLVGKDSLGDICCTIAIEKSADESSKDTITYQFHRDIERGTTLTFKPHFNESEHHITANNLDNRAGVWMALKLAETIENGAIAFSTYEEHGGGAAQFIQRFLYKKYRIRQALIADITWITEGVLEGKGCAISLRDSHIPRKTFVNRVVDIAKRSQIPFQLEVESAGGSDGSVLQNSAFAVDWCFVGAPEHNPHKPTEKIHIDDLQSMLKLYQVLIKEL